MNNNLTHNIDELISEELPIRNRTNKFIISSKAQLICLFCVASVGLLASFSLSLWMILFGIILYLDTSPILLPNHRNMKINYKLLIAPALFLTLCMLSNLYSPDQVNSLKESVSLIGLFILGVYIIKRANDQQHNMLPIITWGFILGIVFLDIEYLTHGFFYNTFNYLISKQADFMLHKLNRNAVSLVILMWGIITYCISVRKYNLAGLLYIMSCIFVMGSECESAKLGLIIGSAIFIGCYLLPKFTLKALVIAIPLILLILPAIILWLVNQDWCIQLVSKLSCSFTHRIFIWKHIGNLIAQQPLFGWGMGSEHVFHDMKLFINDYAHKSEGWQFTIFPSHPHNLGLQIWLETGFVGYTLYVLSITLLFVHLIERQYPIHINAAYFSTLISFLVMCQSSHNIWSSWLIAALVFAVYFIKINRMRILQVE